ncbi:hypothetical protein AXG93_517s1050 [Marchantia polymorpha subsp. ruderalis]|uniref:SAM-dependent MTase RsmB/NOP-type domain-containing protein n=1 Tax=Marchantia polymorpha subsp. ruderalis TaxID=1480154 RepID=A0A176VJR2_MARPO|nr:hypothetical protein AXG93_517s1050 [Marchantia polymorpha subsp. ruderalis]
MENVKLKTAEMAAIEGSGKGMRAPLQRKIRRQAAQILKKVLTGDEQRKSQASIKTLIYAPNIVAKKATLALTCRCLKYLAVIKDIVAGTDLLAKKNKLPAELVYVLTCDMLFGQELLSSGDAENVVLSRKSALQSALVRLLVKKNVTSVEELVATQGLEMSIPRYVRVNTLKIPRWEGIKSLQEIADSVKEDDLIPDLLILPAGTDLHKHPFVLDGSLLLQGKASCMPAPVLAPKPGWEVIDACAAPGNKTVHLAALMKGKGRIHACEVDSKRVLRLRDTVSRAGASSARDTLRSIMFWIRNSSTTIRSPSSFIYSGSLQGLKNKMQKYIGWSSLHNSKNVLFYMLYHVIPAVERVVYSTCSLHQRENEDVVKSVLSQARGFRLATALPKWPHRGLPVFPGANHLVRTEPSRDHMDGFFVALFVRKEDGDSDDELTIVPVQDIPSNEESKASNSSPQSVKPESVENHEAGKLSKLRRRKLKRQRKKEQAAAAGPAKEASS